MWFRNYWIGVCTPRTQEKRGQSELVSELEDGVPKAPEANFLDGNINTTPQVQREWLTFQTQSEISLIATIGVDEDVAEFARRQNVLQFFNSASPRCDNVAAGIWQNVFPGFQLQRLKDNRGDFFLTFEDVSTPNLSSYLDRDDCMAEMIAKISEQLGIVNLKLILEQIMALKSFSECPNLVNIITGLPGTVKSFVMGILVGLICRFILDYQFALVSAIHFAVDNCTDDTNEIIHCLSGKKVVRWYRLKDQLQFLVWRLTGSKSHRLAQPKATENGS